MEPTIKFVINLTTLVIGFAGLYYRSYFAEKGKTKAINENIEKLTTTVESIRTEFIKETERLRVSLQFENTVKTSIHNERLKAIVGVYEAMTLWVQGIQDGFNYSLVFTEHQQIKDAQEIGFNGFRNTVSAQSKMELYVRHEKLRNILDSLRKKVLDLNSEYDTYYFALAADLEQIKIETHAYETMQQGSEKNKMYEHLISLNKEKERRFMTTLEKSKTLRQEIWDTRETFRDICFNLIAETNVTQ